MFKRFFTLLSVVAMVVFGFSSSIHATEVSYGEKKDSVDWESTSESVAVVNADEIGTDKKTLELAEELSNYFEEDTNGDINFTADKDTLIEMGISESDAELMTSADLDNLSLNEGDQQLQGFVGLHLNLGPQVRGMTAVAAGAFAGGYIGWYTSRIAAAGPWGAGAAAAITASTAGTVGWAVNKGLTRVNVGVNVPFVSLSYTVNIP